MKIQELASVTQGIFISRVSVHENDSDGQWVQLYNPPDAKNISKEAEWAYIKKTKKQEDVTTRWGDVIIGISTKKAYPVVDNEDIGKMIVSNFVLLRPTFGKLDGSFLAWYFNHHRDMKRQHSLAQQGVGTTVLSVQAIREMEVNLPAYERQEIMGKIYILTIKKKRWMEQQVELEESLAMEKLKQVFERGTH